MTRWQQLYSEKEEQVLSAPASLSAQYAAQVFARRGKRLILDLGCGAGRDSVYLSA